jgi:DNA topoisomerase-1
MEDITLADAVKLLAEKGKALKPRGAAGRKGKAAAKPAATADNAPRKAPARKAPAKTAAKKPATGKKAAPKKAAAAKAGAKAPTKMARRAAE